MADSVLPAAVCMDLSSVFFCVLPEWSILRNHFSYDHWQVALIPQVSLLEQHAVELRHSIQKQPMNATAHIELGMVLQEIDNLQPDGGSRLPEAEHAYRSFSRNDF